MSKFKVGDKVRVKDNLTLANYEVEGRKTKLSFVLSMEKYKGCKTKIISVRKGSCGGIIYELDIDNREWAWSADMLEPIKSRQVKIADADIVYKATGMGNKAHKGVSRGINKVFKKSFVWYRNGDVITCIIKGFEYKGVGIAKCHPTDKFDYDVGCELAELRAQSDYYINQAKYYFRR